MRHGKPNAAKTAIDGDWYTMGQTYIYTNDDGKEIQTTRPSLELLLADGFLPEVLPVILTFQSRGALIINADNITYEVRITSFLEQRSILKNKAHNIANQKLMSVTSQYSAAEMNQWPEMVTEAKAANWLFFEPMASPGMTGEEYGLIVLEKHTILKAYFDSVIAERNTHKVNIDNTPDDQLAGYSFE